MEKLRITGKGTHHNYTQTYQSPNKNSLKGLNHLFTKTQNYFHSKKQTK